jgi:hypothetical protein
MDEVEKRFDLVPTGAFPYRLLGLVPLNVSNGFEFGKVRVIQPYASLFGPEQSDVVVVDGCVSRSDLLVEFEEQPAATGVR